MNYSMVAGTDARFTSVLTPDNGAQADGTKPEWTVGDASVALAPSADGLSVDVQLPLPYLAPTFDLTVSATSSDPTIGKVTKTHTITVTQPGPPPPPPPPALTGIDFVQVSG